MQASFSMLYSDETWVLTNQSARSLIAAAASEPEANE